MHLFRRIRICTVTALIFVAGYYLAQYLLGEKQSPSTTGLSQYRQEVLPPPTQAIKTSQRSAQGPIPSLTLPDETSVAAGSNNIRGKRDKPVSSLSEIKSQSRQSKRSRKKKKSLMMEAKPEKAQKDMHDKSTLLLPEDKSLVSALDSTTSGSTNVQADDSGVAIVDVLLRTELLYRGLFCRTEGKDLFIPMSDFFGIIFFPIEVDSTGARGWFLQKRNKFNFSSDSGIVHVNTTKYVLHKKQYKVSDDEIYLHIDAFNKFFPLNMKFNTLNQTLTLNPSKLLSFEVLQNRINERRIAEAKNGLLYPLRDLDYAAITQPNLNLKFTAGHRNYKNNETNYGSASGIYRGDLLYMSSVMYGAVDINANEYESKYELNNFSYTGERVFPNNAYLTKFNLGDIVPTQTPIGSSGSLERGIRITNKKLFGSTNFDTQTFTGKVQPGWEVELYRNGQLIGFQSIMEDGTYLFENVELLFGTNRFRIVMYGPEGQEEVKEEVVNVSSTLRSGDVSYDVSISENGVGVFDQDISKVTVQNNEDKGTLRAKGTFRVGVAPNLEFRSGLNYESFAGKDRMLSSIGTDLSSDYGLASLDLGYSSNDSTFLKATMRGDVFDTGRYSIRFDQQFSDKYLESTIKNLMAFGYSDSSKYPNQARVSYGARATRTESVVGECDRSKTYYNISGNFNINSDLGNLSNNIAYQFFENESDGENRLYGQSSYYRGLPHGMIRGSIKYGVKDNGVHLGSATVSGTHRFSPKTKTTLTVDRSFSEDERLVFTNSWSHKIGDYNPFVSGSVDHNGNYRIYAGFGMSIGFESGTFSPKVSGEKSVPSGASCLVYEDKNYNEIFDESDVPLENVTLKSIQSNQKVVTDENGRGLFIHLPPMRSTDIEVDEKTLGNTRFFSTTGTAITPREGKIYELEYPIQLLGAIEGYVYVLKDDTAKARPHIPVQAINEKGKVVGKALSVSGGYFSIEKLRPGKYSVRISPDYLEKKELIQDGGTIIQIDGNGDTVSRPLIFYGDKKTVAVLSPKFRQALTFGEEVVLSIDFNQLDNETDFSYSQPTAFSLKDIDSKLIQPDMSAANTSGKSAKASQANLAKRLMPKDTTQRYALVVDVFISKKSALRAVDFYKRKYAEELNNYTLIHNQNGDTHEVLVSGIKNKQDIKEITDLFLCSPRIEKFDTGSLSWIEVTSPR